MDEKRTWNGEKNQITFSPFIEIRNMALKIGAAPTNPLTFRRNAHISPHLHSQIFSPFRLTAHKSSHL
ncbi:MAG: hypothetical protein ACRYGJ_17560, partial [Janthinobacterium lividum]